MLSSCWSVIKLTKNQWGKFPQRKENDLQKQTIWCLLKHQLRFYAISRKLFSEWLRKYINVWREETWDWEMAGMELRHCLCGPQMCWVLDMLFQLKTCWNIIRSLKSAAWVDIFFFKYALVKKIILILYKLASKLIWMYPFSKHVEFLLW